jgi:anti-sigma regulatory factor (Ser/Thr protein kinase)
VTRGTRLQLTASMEAPGIARRHVVAACQGLGDEATAAAELLTSELVTNAVIHPDLRRRETEGTVSVSITPTRRGVRVEVRDDDPRPIPPPPVAPATQDLHGRGLFLVNELASAWGSYVPSESAKVVWFEVRATARHPVGPG